MPPILLAFRPLWFLFPRQGQALNIRIMLKERRIFSPNFWNYQDYIKWGLASLVKGENEISFPNDSDLYWPPSFGQMMPLFCPHGCIYHNLCLSILSSTVLMVMMPLTPICYGLIHSILENGVKVECNGN